MDRTRAGTNGWASHWSSETARADFAPLPAQLLAPCQLLCRIIYSWGLLCSQWFACSWANPFWGVRVCCCNNSGIITFYSYNFMIETPVCILVMIYRINLNGCPVWEIAQRLTMMTDLLTGLVAPTRHPSEMSPPPLLTNLDQGLGTDD